MKTIALCRNVTVSSLVAILGTCQPTSAVAQALIWAGDVNAFFGKPTKFDGNPEDAVYSGVETSKLTHGQGDPGSSFEVLTKSFSTPTNSAFSFGEFTFSNGVTQVGTNITSVPINISFDFSLPVPFNVEFDVTLLHQPTTNPSNPTVLVPDTVTIENKDLSKKVTINGKVYDVEILGFTTDRGRELTVQEQQSDTKNLFAIISFTPTPETVEQSLSEISTSPGTGSTAGVISAAYSTSTTKSPSQFQKDVSNLVAGATWPVESVKKEAADALNAVTNKQAVAPLSSARNSVSTNGENLTRRIDALHKGARGFQLQGHTIGTANQDWLGNDLAGTFSTVGGAASADDGSTFILGEGRLGGFVNGTISSGDKEETRNEDGFNFSTWGITAGVDYRFRDNLIAGIAGGYNKSETDMDNSGGKLDTKSYNISLYGTYFEGESAYVDAILTYGRNDYDQERNIRYSIADYNVSQTASADYDGSQWSGAIGFGYDIPKGPWTFGPVVRAQYLSTDVDGYSESMSSPNTNGGGWATRLDDTDQESFTTTLGGNVSRAIGTKWGVLLPQLHLSWTHEFVDDAISINGTFIEDPSNNVFDIRSDRSDSDYFNARLAMSAQFAGGSSAFLYYNKVLGYRDLNVDTFGAGVRLEF